jgi:hypothetical protein
MVFFSINRAGVGGAGREQGLLETVRRALHQGVVAELPSLHAQDGGSGPDDLVPRRGQRVAQRVAGGQGRLGHGGLFLPRPDEAHESGVRRIAQFSTEKQLGIGELRVVAADGLGDGEVLGVERLQEDLALLAGAAGAAGFEGNRNPRDRAASPD